MLNAKKINELEQFAAKIRIETIKEMGNLGFGHLGGAMSVVETLAVLYGSIMNIDPMNPKWEDRDWLICSKGHAGPAIYATLAMKGYFRMEELLTLNKPGTKLPSHCDRNRTIGIDMTTGSLGQGASLAVGIAMGNRLDGRKNRTYLILGDGELQEGQVWEAVLLAAHQKLDSLITFVDNNKQQLDGFTEDICGLGDIAGKFESFGWYTQDIDGANVSEIHEAVLKAQNNKGRPSVIVSNTIKGKGCCFAEGKVDNHHVTISMEQMEQALDELNKTLEKVVVI